MKKTVSFVLTIIFIFLFCGCSSADSQSGGDAEKRIIAVSIVPQATFAKKICGESFEIVTLIPPGASPETYELTTEEMKKLEKASIYFSVGVPAEEASIIPIVNENTETVRLEKIVSESYPDLMEGEGRDPHIWLSPKRVKLMVEAMAEELGELDSKNKELYNSNAEKYIAELDAADKEIRALLGGKEGGRFIAFHPAFGYFADEYGLTQYALEEHGKEATAKRLADMTDLARKENIKVIFYQAETSGRQAEAFAEEIGGKAVSLEPLAADYIGNLKKMGQALSEAIE